MLSSWKQQIRQQMRQVRRAWLNEVTEPKAAWDLAVARRLAQVLQDNCGLSSSAESGALVALYRAMDDEVDPLGVRDLLPQWQWCYPKVEGSDLQFFLPQSERSFAPGAFAILEPDPLQADRVELNQCAACVVPAVAFDQGGGRLGQGKGFYDRALKNYQGLKVGLAYSVQMSEGLFPRESHDVLMDVVITEKFVVKVRSKERIEEG